MDSLDARVKALEITLTAMQENINHHADILHELESIEDDFDEFSPDHVNNKEEGEWPTE